jgi:hypothetical protein
VYQAGSYYDYILSVAETSLNNFLSDTTFPYTETETAQFPGGSTGGMGGGADRRRETQRRASARA